MAWRDVLRVLIGRKTDAEIEAERRFKEAIDQHKYTNGEVKELAEKLGRARADVHARIEALATGGPSAEGQEAPDHAH